MADSQLRSELLSRKIEELWFALSLSPLSPAAVVNLCATLERVVVPVSIPMPKAEVSARYSSVHLHMCISAFFYLFLFFVSSHSFVSFVLACSRDCNFFFVVVSFE